MNVKMTEKKEKASLHIRVWGRVQGVGFRAFVAKNAADLDLTGWVRNVGYDQVETRAEGAREDLEKLVRIIQRGPSASRVEKDDISWGDFQRKYSSFRVRWF